MIGHEYTLKEIQAKVKPIDIRKQLINSIHIDKANFEYIVKTGKINGTLLTEIKRVMSEYAEME